MLVSGMVIGTVFTLFVVPSIYVLLARTHAVAPQRDARPVRVPELAEAS
jgi:multidrug efflux pump